MLLIVKVVAGIALVGFLGILTTYMRRVGQARLPERKPAFFPYRQRTWRRLMGTIPIGVPFLIGDVSLGKYLPWLFPAAKDVVVAVCSLSLVGFILAQISVLAFNRPRFLMLARWRDPSPSEAWMDDPTNRPTVV